MPASRRFVPVLAALLLIAACGGDGAPGTTTSAATSSTTLATTTTTAATTTTSTAPPDTGPLAPLLADPVADPLLDTGYHQMTYGDAADGPRDFVVSAAPINAAGGRLSLGPFVPLPVATGVGTDQMLLEAWVEPAPGGPIPRAMVLYGLGVGGWNPYITVEAAAVLAYLETTTDYAARRPDGPADVRLAPLTFDWTGSAHFVADVAVFAYPAGESPAYQGQIECTYATTLECVTLSDDGVLRPGDEGDAVLALQEALADLGYYSGALDGIYDDDTEGAVRLFQRDYRLAVDGKAGPQTQSLLEDVVSGTSQIVLASQYGVGDVLFGTPADTARPALYDMFGPPDALTGWYEDLCDDHMWSKVTWGGFTAIFTDRNGSRQFDGWHVDDLANLPLWLYFAGGIRPSWRWSDFAAMGAGFDPWYSGYWYQHDLGYNDGRFVDPPSNPPAANALIRSFGTGTGSFVSC